MAPPRHPLQEGSFDPLALLRRSRGQGNSDVRTIMLRMLWLRQRVPEARVETALVSIDDHTVVMSAAISLPDGGQGSGHAAMRIDAETGPGAAVESAETQAIGRALDILGYVVTESSSEPSASDDRRPATSPQPITRDERRPDPPGHVQALRQMKNRDRPQLVPSPQEPTPIGPYPEMQEATTKEPESRAEPSQQPASADVRTEPSQESESVPHIPHTGPASDDSDEPEMEDISWTAFWDWARSTYQMKSRGQLEEILGQPVGNKTPGALRLLLITHFAGNTTDESSPDA
ncbi:MAG: hypothetical protein H0V98_03835 [Chloroflexia bacterium]|nr:hypothetical protein [Chloroflexia bacterium]